MAHTRCEACTNDTLCWDGALTCQKPGAKIAPAPVEPGMVALADAICPTWSTWRDKDVGRAPQLIANFVRAKHEELYRRLEQLQADHGIACQTVAEMHAAAVGQIQGPIRGVVEDVADLRVQLLAKDTEIRRMAAALETAANRLTDVSDGSTEAWATEESRTNCAIEAASAAREAARTLPMIHPVSISLDDARSSGWAPRLRGAQLAWLESLVNTKQNL